MLDVILQFLNQVFTSLGLPVLVENDCGFDHHTSNLVRHTCYGTFHYGGVSHESTLNLKRADAITARLDDIVDTTLKPIVAVLVAPCHVASVIHIVVPYIVRQFLVTIILLEQSYRLPVSGPYDNLTLLSVLTWSAVGLDEVDVILRIGQSHRSWLRLCPRHGAESHCGLRLSESLHKRDAREFLELVEYGGIESLTGCTAIAKRR